MKKLAVFLSLCLFAIQAFAENQNLPEIKSVILPMLQQYHVKGAAVAVIADGQPHIYLFGKTAPNPEQPKIVPVTAHTPFELGSITKVMTTFILAKEAQNQQIKLSDSLTKYLPALNSNPAFRKTTLEQLATHTSGLPFLAPANIKTPRALGQYLLHWQPIASSQTIWQYSNMGMGLLGEALEEKEHQNFEQLFSQNIFRPFRMTDSIFVARAQDQPWPQAWAVASSITDMTYFLEAAMGLPATSKHIQLAMRLAETPCVQAGDMQQALGWQVFSLRNTQILLNKTHRSDILLPRDAKNIPENQQHYDADVLIDKTGQTSYFQNYIAFIPARKAGIVILMNSRKMPMNEIIYAGREILLAAYLNPRHVNSGTYKSDTRHYRRLNISPIRRSHVRGNVTPR